MGEEEQANAVKSATAPEEKEEQRRHADAAATAELAAAPPAGLVRIRTAISCRCGIVQVRELNDFRGHDFSLGHVCFGGADTSDMGRPPLFRARSARKIFGFILLSFLFSCFP